MIAKQVFSRFFAVLISINLLFAASPSFAAMGCCDPANMVMHMAGQAHSVAAADQRMNSMNMGMVDDAHHGISNQHKNMPCKMPAGICTSVCASMANVALTVPQVSYSAPTLIGKAVWAPTSLPGGITHLPALPPPISRA